MSEDRRAFLRRAARRFRELAALGVCGGALSACTVPPRSFRTDATGPVRVPRARYPELGRAGGVVKIIAPDNFVVYLRRGADDALDALSGVCTHQGCIVAPERRGFRCPCHGSTYDVDGRNTGGPAPAPLERFRVEESADHIIVHLE